MNNTTVWLKNLPEDLQQHVSTDTYLKDLTTFSIGGPATCVCRIHNPTDASRFHAFVAQHKIPHYIIGGGSNILAADSGYQGLIFHIKSENLQATDRQITVGAGIGLDTLINKTLSVGLTGLEFASGIPGSLGGALVGNAGCYGHEIGELFVSALIMRPDGSLETVQADEFGFGYRHTKLRETGSVLLEATLKLHWGDAGQARKYRDDLIADRYQKHPKDLPCAGSYFRNLPPARAGERRQAAGKLLELVGAKGMREGDAGVFCNHANMIVNHGQATSKDVLQLAQRMKNAVREKFQVDLIEEVRYLALPSTDE